MSGGTQEFISIKQESGKPLGYTIKSQEEINIVITKENNNMKKAYDLAVKTGSYQKGEKTKNKYVNVGAIMEKDDGGRFILLDRTFNPAGVPNPEDRENLIVSMFEPKDKMPDFDN